MSIQCYINLNKIKCRKDMFKIFDIKENVRKISEYGTNNKTGPIVNYMEFNYSRK